MEVEAKSEGLAKTPENRRVVPRFPVDEYATILLVLHGVTISCHIVDISQSGCRVLTDERFAAGILVRVEIRFSLCGLAFRFAGLTQWTDGLNTVGIRFLDVSQRRREELAEALMEVEEKIVAEAQKREAEEEAAELRAAALEAAKSPPEAQPSTPLPEAAAEVPAEPAPLPPPPEPPTTLRDRRAQPRYMVDTPAVIHFINVASRLPGQVRDLSLGGCHIRTDERFPVGIYTRVEVEFRLEGLPVRIGGVIQAIHNQFNVGIRFLDLSERKQKQLEGLMALVAEKSEYLMKVEAHKTATQETIRKKL